MPALPGMMPAQLLWLKQKRHELEADRDILRSIRRAAMNALARREHTRHELEQKLMPKFPGSVNGIRLVIDQLVVEGLQSDQRFAESYIRWRAARGYGPVRISLELSQKGIADELLDDSLSQSGIDWQEHLRDQFTRKFGEEGVQSLEEKAKAMRFFQYRGFSHSDINRLFKKAQP